MIRLKIIDIRGFCRPALMLSLTFILLALPILSACAGPSFNPKEDEESEDTLPVIFIPGVQGSQLVSEKDARVLWPPGGQGGSVGVRDIPSIRDDFYRLSLNPSSEHEAIFASDVIRFYGNDPVYRLFLEALTAEGYAEYVVNGNPSRRNISGAELSQKPKPNLFVFAYDWRQPIEEISGALSEYVEVVNQFYPDKQVNLVTHSLGGLVARRYIIDHPGKVNKLITVAAPLLGSPKPLYQMIYAKLSAPVAYGSEAMWASTIDTLTGGTSFGEGPIAGMLNYYASVHQLMSSEMYFNIGGPPYTVVETLSESVFTTSPRLPQTIALSFQEFMGPNGKVDTLFPNPLRVGVALKTPAKANRDFHSYSSGGNSQDDWSNDSTGVKYYHLIGVQDSNDNVLALREATGYTAAQVRDYSMNVFGPGDGTVPLLSSARMGQGKNLNAPGAKLFIYTGGKSISQTLADISVHSSVTLDTGNPDKLTEHTGIMTNQKAITKIIELLKEEKQETEKKPEPAVKTSSTPVQPTGFWKLAETKLPSLPPQPIKWSDQFGDIQ